MGAVELDGVLGGDRGIDRRRAAGARAAEVLAPQGPEGVRGAEVWALSTSDDRTLRLWDLEQPDGTGPLATWDAGANIVAATFLSGSRIGYLDARGEAVTLHLQGGNL